MNKKIVFLSVGFVVLLVFFVFIFGIFLEKRAEEESSRTQSTISAQRIDWIQNKGILEKQAQQPPTIQGQAGQEMSSEEKLKEETTTSEDTKKQEEKTLEEKPEYQPRFEGPLLN